MKIKNKLPLYIALTVAAVYLASWVSGWHLAINSTKSMPRGIYLVTPLHSVERGQVVSLCISNQAAIGIYLARRYLSASGQCQASLPRLLKPVVAVPGDLVTITAAGTAVNGQLLPNSGVFDTDSEGRDIGHLPLGWSKRLDAGEYFVLANYLQRSLDSRYYGTLRRDDLKGRAWPLITF
ncbi:conjugative transfer signal peptidase TraF [Massilia sp. MP_M2]|uniref:conjugative transfer signal peptidase TraF n=1 Tax=Massilia sp. MP_M2 TaxID=3071713 RepID=UPI00319E6A87